MESRMFSDEMDQKLINFVRSHPALYHPGHENFRDTAMKENFWSEISSEMGRTVAEIKTRWRTIRDSYKKNKKKIRNDPDLKTALKSKYNNEDLNFLDSCFLQERPPISKTDKCVTSQPQIISVRPQIFELRPLSQSKITTATTTFNNNSGSVINVSETTNQNKEVTKSAVVTQDAKRPLIITPAKTNTLSEPDAQKRPKLENVEAKILEQIKADREEHFKILRNLLSERKETNTEHPVETFFRSMAKTVMTFPPHLIAEARMKVCNVISEIEIQSLLEQDK